MGESHMPLSFCLPNINGPRIKILLHGLMRQRQVKGDLKDTFTQLEAKVMF